ncbi:MAG: terminase large subunit [Patescibacteria group bacterium]
MVFHPAQSQIAKDTHRFRVVNCGRRFGKTTLSAYEILGCALAFPEARVPYYAPTRDDARDIMWGILQKAAGAAIIDKNEARLELTVRNRHGNNSFIPLYGWESVQERGKGVGVKNNFIVFDEVAKYRNFWLGWQEILRPTLTDLRGGAMFISTPKGFNHFYDLYNLENQDSDYKSFHFTTYDNPYISKEEIEKAKKELTEDRFAQEYLADFRKTEGLVYKEFDRDRHLFEEPGFEGEDFVCVKNFGGVDPGFTNPCAVLTVKKDRDANYWVMSEWYKTGQTDAQIADYVAALRWNECYPDPENPGVIEELKRRGVNVREVIKGQGSVKNGINIVRELFKAGRLYIHTSCQNLIWELEIYSYPDKKAGHNENEDPIKENDHAADALRYALSMESGNVTGQSVHIHRPSYAGYNRRA